MKSSTKTQILSKSLDTGGHSHDNKSHVFLSECLVSLPLGWHYFSSFAGESDSIPKSNLKSKENKYIAACFFKVKESHNVNLEVQRDWHLLSSCWTVEIG